MNRHPKIARALRAARKPYADGGDITTADIRRGLADRVTNRATLLPLADYADGSTRLAWPGLLYEPAAAWKRMVDEGPTAEDSFTVASAIPIAGLAAAAVRPGASLGSGGGKIAPTAGRLSGSAEPNLPQSRQMASDRLGHTPAASSGPPAPGTHGLTPHDLSSGAFDTSEVYYRGMSDDVSRFRSSFNPGQPKVSFFTSDPLNASDYAFSYAGKDGTPSVYPVHARRDDRLVFDAKGKRFDEINIDDLAAEAAAEGHRTLLVKNVIDPGGNNSHYPTDTLVALKPGTIKSATTGDILFSNSTRASSPGLAALESNRVRGGMGDASLVGDKLGRGLAHYASDEHYPQTGLNPIHPVDNWAYVRKLVRAARRGDEIPPILYDGLPNNGNLLAGTHRSAANEIIKKTGKGNPIDMVALDDVLSDPTSYGLTRRDARRLREAVEDGDFDAIDSIWDQR